jgi:N,N'-diacetyllegionaminate synthase
MHDGHIVRCLIVAEAGVNHNVDLGMALDLVDLAVEAGADFIKFQTSSADCLATAAIGFLSTGF